MFDAIDACVSFCSSVRLLGGGSGRIASAGGNFAARRTATAVPSNAAVQLINTADTITAERSWYTRNGNR